MRKLNHNNSTAFILSYLGGEVTISLEHLTFASITVYSWLENESTSIRFIHMCAKQVANLPLKTTHCLVVFNVMYVMILMNL